MHIEHIAIWTRNLESLRNFYEKYFAAESGEKYVNERKQFESYFLQFDSGARLELMCKTEMQDSLRGNVAHAGYAHMAMSLGSKNKVDELTEQLRSDGISVASEPRYTGDGYYESCVLDPDGNLLELTE